MTEEYVRITMCLLIEAEGEEAQEEAIVRHVYADGFKAGVEAAVAAVAGSGAIKNYTIMVKVIDAINAAKPKEDTHVD